MEVKILNKNAELAPEMVAQGFVNPFDEPQANEGVEQPTDLGAEPTIQEGAPPQELVQEPLPAFVEPPAQPVTQAQIDHWAELGIDDDGKKILEAYKSGKLDEFVSIKNTDYDKMSDLELLKLELTKKYPNMSKEKLDVLYNKKLSSYGLNDELDEDAMETGKILLEADMLSVRDGLKAKQKEYIIKDFQSPNQVNQEQVLAQQAELAKYINTLPEFKNFEQNRTVKFGNGEVNYVAPNDLDLKRATVDPDYFFSQFMGADKALKSEKWIKAVAYANNAEMVEKALIDYGKSLGRKEENEALRNPSSRVQSETHTGTEPTVRIIGRYNL